MWCYNDNLSEIRALYCMICIYCMIRALYCMIRVLYCMIALLQLCNKIKYKEDSMYKYIHVKLISGSG